MILSRLTNIRNFIWHCNYYRTFKRSLMLQKENPCIKTFWIWRSRYILLNLSSVKHVTIFCSFWRAVLNEKIWYVGKTRKIYTSSFCSKVLALNAWFFLLEHQWVFESSVIVAYESLIGFSVKRWISKSYSQCWKGFKYTKMLENQRMCGICGTVELFRTNKGLMNN